MMDSDDISLPERFARQVRYFDLHPECCALVQQRCAVLMNLPIYEWPVPEHHQEIDGMHMTGGGGAIVNPTVMMRKSAVLQVGGYRQGYDYGAEDYDLFLRLAEIGSLANLPEVLLNYRVHVGSLTFARAAYQDQMAFKALEEAWTRRGRSTPPPPRKMRKVIVEDELIWEWGLNAFSAGNFNTARKAGTEAFAEAPVRPPTLGLVRCQLRGTTGVDA